MSARLISRMVYGPKVVVGSVERMLVSRDAKSVTLSCVAASACDDWAIVVSFSGAGAGSTFFAQPAKSARDAARTAPTRKPSSVEVTLAGLRCSQGGRDTGFSITA